MSIEFKLPELGENITNGDVVNVLVHEGDVIVGNQGVIELETEKAVVEIPCPHAGKVTKVHVTKGQTVKVGQLVVTIEPVEAAEPQAVVAAAEEKPVSAAPSAVKLRAGAAPAATVAAPSEIAAGPEARRVARELGVDLATIRGSGKGGRITADDVRAAATAPAKPRAAVAPRAPVAPAELPTPPGEPGQDAFGPVTRERMPKIRRTIAAQMVKSAGTIPHVTNFDDADATDLERLRQSIPASFLAPKAKLTILPFAIRALALALRQHPVVNASIDETKEEVIYKRYVNIGVAVDTPRGLVVPVIRNADQFAVIQLAEQLTALTERARAAEFAMEELRGGTFTVSNLGAVGGAYSTPIINHPEVAILLLGRARPVLRMHEGKIEERLMLPLSLSYDHRIVDGAAAARFLGDVIRYLEAPATLLL